MELFFTALPMMYIFHSLFIVREYFLMLGTWCGVYGQAHQGLTVVFLILGYSVICNDESLSLFHFYFVSILCLELFVLGHDTSMSKGSFMQTIRFCVLIYI